MTNDCNVGVFCRFTYWIRWKEQLSSISRLLSIAKRKRATNSTFRPYPVQELTLKGMYLKTYSKWIWKRFSQFFVISNCWVGLCFSYPSYLNMWLLKSSKNFDQIIIMRWINQAYTLGPKTWVWLINIKKGHNIQSFYLKCW